MSQKYIKSQNKNSHNAKSFGKYYAKPVYDEKFVETDEIADFIQTQATLKRSDIKAALDELGAAMKHFLEMGQKIRLAGIGIFKVGFLSQQLIDTGVLDWIDSKTYTTAEIGEKWYKQLQTGIDTLGRHYTPEKMAELFESPDKNKVWGKVEKMLSPAVYEYMSDANHFNTVPEVATSASQALHRALAANSVASNWEPQHRIQFFHSKPDIIVPYGNFLAYRDAHPHGEGNMYRIDDTFSANDHLDAGASFLMTLLAVKGYGAYFNWICEGGTPTGIAEIGDVRGKMSEVWYTLDGRRLNGKPTQKGVYIHQGKSIVIR